MKVDSEDAFKFLEEFFKDQSRRYNHYWLGLNDIKKEGSWVWTDGTVLGKTNWRTTAGEPNNLENEDCVETMLDGKWNDNTCDRIFGFICERGVDSILPAKPTLPTYPVAPKGPLTCETGWIPWGNSCYGFIIGVYKSWFDAKSDCERRFGNLVIINDADEQAFITNHIGNTEMEYWIGLSDHYSDTHFFWVDKSPLDQSKANWAPNEPSNEFGDEDCVEIYGKWMPGKWNDDHCSTLQNYICEKNGGVHNCPQGWVPFKNYCYQINAHPNQVVSWETARKNCLDFNKDWRDNIDVAQADLVSILSDGEQEMLIQEFNKLNVEQREFWLGLTKTNSTEFYWTDGSPVSYKAWKGTIAVTGFHFNCAVDTMKSGINSWQPADCKQKFLYVCKVAKGQDRCYSPLGVQNYHIPNNAMTSSSYLSHETRAPAGRLYLKANEFVGGAWCAGKDKYPWLQIDFGNKKKLTYMSIQGKSNSAAMVTSYYLKYSLDGILWERYGDIPPAKYIRFRAHLAWRTDNEKVMNLPLSIPLVARFIRVYPLQYNIAICMRVEFYGCEDEIENQRCGLHWIEDKETRNCYKFSHQKTTWDTAESLCNIQGGSLVSIDSVTEYNFLKKKMSDHVEDADDYWIGLNDLEDEGFRKWSDKSSYIYKKWLSRYPKTNDVRRNCAVMRTKDGYWTDEDCLTFHHFVCKIPYKDPHAIKLPFNNNWKTMADYFWPFSDLPVDDSLDGTILAKSFGKFERKKFKTAYPNEKQRYSLEFKGENTYVVINDLDECVSHPDSNSCPNGITVAFNFKYKHETTTKEKVILDTFKTKENSVGFKVYIRFSKIYILLRGAEYYFYESISFEQDSHHHFVFTWSNLKGVSIYLDGKHSVTQLHGSSNKEILRSISSKKLLIGKSFYAEKTNSKYLHLSSLAIFERVLKDTEIKEIYLAEFGDCSAYELSHGSYCYKFNLTSVTWPKAQVQCQRDDGILVSINSPVEQALISRTVGKNGYYKDSWIGLYTPPYSRAKWTDSSPVSFTFWGKNEPSLRRDYSKVCVTARKRNGAWAESGCYYSHRSPFVCKYKKRILSKDSYDADTKKAFLVTLPSYSRHTFGCPYGYQLELLSAEYGNLDQDCLLDVKDKIQDFCNVSVCTNIVIYKMKLKNPCMNERYGFRRTYIKYSCNKKIAEPLDEGCNANSVDGYIAPKESNVCYKLYHFPRTFSNALSICNKDGGTLAVINSRDTDLFLTSLMDTMYVKKDIWIGMSYQRENHTFTWVNGEEVKFTHWYNGHPDTRNGHFVSVSVKDGAKSFLFWNIATGNETLPFFCQRNKIGFTTKAPTTTLAPNISCPENWIMHNQQCYYFDNETKTYIDAKISCMDLDSNLASILSEDENEIIFESFVKKKFMFAWIGLSNEALLHGFEWEDGSPVTFVNWFFTRPYTGNRHFCTGMNSGGKWWDVGCSLKFPYICKKSAIVDAMKTTEKPTITIPKINPNQSFCLSNKWIQYNDSCYYLSKSSDKLDYYAARSACAKEGSNLVSIVNTEENEFVTAYLKKNKIGKIFIGLSDLTAEGSWMWLDNSPLSYFNFRNGEPDNFLGMEDCVVMEKDSLWSDVPCNLKRNFMCKQTNGSSVVSRKNITKTDGYCNDGWSLYGDKCYLFVKKKEEKRSFVAAQEYCQSKGGGLVTIQYNYENAYLLSQIHDVNEPMFIGLIDSQKKHEYVWVDQSPVPYTNWYKSEPSYYPRNERCVEMKVSFMAAGRWNNIHCDFKHKFICQRDQSSHILPTVSKPPKTDKEDSKCPEGFIEYRDSCYKKFMIPKTFDAAIKSCRSFDNGDLVSIHNPFEQAFLFSNFVFSSSTTPISWIGLKKIGKENPFWSDNSKVEFENYFRGRYNSKTINNEKCAVMESSVKIDGKWKYQNCTSQFPYLCKITREFDDIAESAYIGNCSNGWTKIKDKCYKVFGGEYKYAKSWTSARQTCRGYGGDLVEIPNEEIQIAIQHLAKNIIRQLWIGLNDRNIEKVFEWSNGKALLPGDYSNWYFNEPNDIASKENCVEMTRRDLLWNDNKCDTKRGYVCEHPLECNNALGMEDGSIGDDNIHVTSSYGGYTKHMLRMNSSDSRIKYSAWCTNVTTMEESITVNLGEMMCVSRITTRGKYHSDYDKRSYVTNYLLEYSIDGKHWMKYVNKMDDVQNTQVILLPGNTESEHEAGTTVDLKATYLRITPKSYKGDLICMRLEFYGCKSKCKRALGMEGLAIHDNQLKASSQMIGSEKTKARPNNMNRFWCAKDLNRKQFYEVDFEKTVNITRIMVASRHPIKYLLKLSNDGKSYKTHVTYNNQERIFNSKHTTYDLTLIESARFVKIIPIEWKESICLQVEFYGCVHECDSPLGMQSGEIPDDVIKVSSSQIGYESNMARLSTSDTMTGKAWCANEINKNQYLEIDFKQKAHINRIAVQGLQGEIDKYVTKYQIQWSNDDDFWHQVEEKMVGNKDGRSIESRKLFHPIDARYVRINPLEWTNHICMKVEFFGCPLGNISAIINRKTTKHSGKLRLTNVQYRNDFADQNSDAFKKLAEQIEEQITSLYIDHETLKDGFDNVYVDGFMPGSVIVSYTIYTVAIDNNDDVIKPLEEAIKSGQLGRFEVDPKYIYIYKNTDTHKLTTTHDHGMSNSVKIFLIVFFILLVVIILLFGTIYYLRAKQNVSLRSPRNFFRRNSEKDGDEMKVVFINEEET